MPIPDYQSLMLPVLSASSNGEVRISAVVEALADKLGLDPQERAELLPSGKQSVGCRIEDTLHIKKIDEEFFEA